MGMASVLARGGEWVCGFVSGLMGTQVRNGCQSGVVLKSSFVNKVFIFTGEEQQETNTGFPWWFRFSTLVLWVVGGQLAVS